MITFKKEARTSSCLRRTVRNDRC